MTKKRTRHNKSARNRFLVTGKTTRKKERRVLHANGDGTFFSDGEFYNRRKEMKSHLPAGVKRF